jgi:hypothetical protein
MDKKTAEVKISDLECCPELGHQPVCDTLNFRYRLPFRQRVGDAKQRIPVEVLLHFRLERCSGPLVIGDPTILSSRNYIRGIFLYCRHGPGDERPDHQRKRNLQIKL